MRRGGGKEKGDGGIGRWGHKTFLANYIFQPSYILPSFNLLYILPTFNLHISFQPSTFIYPSNLQPLYILPTFNLHISFQPSIFIYFLSFHSSTFIYPFNLQPLYTFHPSILQSSNLHTYFHTSILLRCIFLEFSSIKYKFSTKYKSCKKAFRSYILLIIAGQTCGPNVQICLGNPWVPWGLYRLKQLEFFKFF